ncbi:hypothetical protein [Pelagibaculum spongiae]|uniref:DUF1302 domain-containing protein n=1 Tax=Pelagibaculum spongiae TaxID=2080658 RepID=A0A2V1GXH3_9GAMM|nr:hypothetical protein [Pelagibaculum spongiae]PVZ66405.1 hypothetical protein DC094_17065 [Pelagibaculum spongiae]
MSKHLSLWLAVLVLSQPAWGNENLQLVSTQNEQLDSEFDSDFSDDNFSDDGFLDDAWNDTDQQESLWFVQGFSEFGGGIKTHDGLISNDASLLELRQRVDADYSGENIQFSGKLDVFYDDLSIDYSDNQAANQGELKYKLRQARFDLSLADTDLRLGRQTHTWGLGDLIFLNDLFPKNWVAFFSGLDDEYMKQPQTSIKLSHSFSDWNIELVVSPEFAPSQSISGQRFVWFDPRVQSVAATDPQANQTKQSEWAIRASRSIDRYELALYGYRGFYKLPAAINDDNIFYHPRLSSLGFSLQGPWDERLFKLESSIYMSEDNRSGQLANLPNDQFRLLVGVEQEVASKLTLGLQYYLENTLDYQQLKQSRLGDDTIADRYRQLLTARLTQQALQDKLIISLLSFYSPTDQDAYLRPQIHYKPDDQWRISAGGNLFYGKKIHTFFGQFEENTNLWLRLRYQY